MSLDVGTDNETLEGTELNREQIDTFVHRSLMLVSALSPVIVPQLVTEIRLDLPTFPHVRRTGLAAVLDGRPC